MSAQQFVSCGVERDISRDRTGVREPMLNTSAAINNRAASFIGHNLSPTRTFQRKFSICLFFCETKCSSKNCAFSDKTNLAILRYVGVDFVKILCKRF